MRHVLLGLALLLATSAHGASTKKVVSSGGSPIPATYTTGSQSLILASLPTTTKHVLVINDTASRIAFSVDHDSPAYAPTNDVKDFYIPAGGAVALDDLASTRQVYLRSDSGSTITSGNVYVAVW